MPSAQRKIRHGVIALSLFALSVLGGKCKGPKPPKADTAAAVEQAYWEHDVAELGDGESVTVEVEVAIEVEGIEPTDDTITHAWAAVVFERQGDLIVATFSLDEHAYDFSLSGEGEARTR